MKYNNSIYLFDNLSFRTSRRGCHRVVTTPGKLPKCVYVRSYGTTTTTTSSVNGQPGKIWKYTRKFSKVISLPITIGVSLIAVLQWRYLRKNPYQSDDEVVKGPLNDLMVNI